VIVLPVALKVSFFAGGPEPEARGAEPGWKHGALPDPGRGRGAGRGRGRIFREEVPG